MQQVSRGENKMFSNFTWTMIMEHPSFIKYVSPRAIGIIHQGNTELHSGGMSYHFIYSWKNMDRGLYW